MVVIEFTESKYLHGDPGSNFKVSILLFILKMQLEL